MGPLLADQLTYPLAKNYETTMIPKKKKAIIMPGSIRSHLLPSFYLAQKLAGDYDIYYLLNDPTYEKLVTDQGYYFMGLKTRDIGNYCEYHYVNRKYKRYSRLVKFCIMIKLFLFNDLYRKRRKELRSIVDRIEPDIALIDVFTITNFLFIYPYHTHTAISFFSPMLSTHYTPGIPLVCESSWVNTQKPAAFFYSPAKRWSDRLYKKLDNWQLKRCCRLASIPRKHRLTDKNLMTTYFFENVPELVLAPVELEFSKTVKRPGQHYLGLCTNLQRNETGADPRFNIRYFQQRKQQGQKIIYCSFGTYFHAYHQHLLVSDFVTRVVEAFSVRDDVELIIAVNDKLQSIFQDTIPAHSHIHFYSLVPQLRILEIADVFITHGGLGSIKEAVNAAVPMLVYPLDFRWDQPGNALKVAHHALGLRGEMQSETADAIEEKVDMLTSSQLFKQQVVRFRDSIREEDWPGQYPT